jgi:hypothetical protein
MIESPSMSVKSMLCKALRNRLNCGPYPPNVSVTIGRNSELILSQRSRYFAYFIFSVCSAASFLWAALATIVLFSGWVAETSK